MSDFQQLFGELEDAGRTHSRYAPSSLKRILACPRSVALSESLATGKPGHASVYAAEGTVAHEVAEAWLNSPPVRAHGPRVVDGHTVLIDEDMHTHGRAYADYINALMVPGDKLYVEVTVSLDAIVGSAANMYGHCDAAVWSPSRRTLIVCDYKYGRGIKVVAIGNEQLHAYALGALMSIKDIDPDDVLYLEMHVFQPRVPGQTPPDRVAAVDLLMWGSRELAPTIEAIERDGAIGRPLITGDHCRFCPALTNCPAQRKRANDAVKRAFDDGKVADVVALSDQDLAAALGEARVVEAWIDATKKEALSRALAGRTIPGNKLVDTRGRRVWKTTTAVEQWCRSRHIDPFEAPTLRSVAQIEKQLPPEGITLGGFADLYEIKSSGRTLVPLTDPRHSTHAGSAKELFDDGALDNSED